MGKLLLDSYRTVCGCLSYTYVHLGVLAILTISIHTGDYGFETRKPFFAAGTKYDLKITYMHVRAIIN